MIRAFKRYWKQLWCSHRWEMWNNDFFCPRCGAIK